MRFKSTADTSGPISQPPEIKYRDQKIFIHWRFLPARTYISLLVCYLVTALSTEFPHLLRGIRDNLEFNGSARVEATTVGQAHAQVLFLERTDAEIRE